MKLLTKKEVERQKTKHISQEVVKAKKISDFLEKKRRDLNVYTKKMQMDKETLDKDFFEFSTSTQQKKNELSNEISILENKKRELLKPIDEIKKETELLHESNKQKEAILKKKEESLDIKERNLNTSKRTIDSKRKKLSSLALSLQNIQKSTKERENEVLLSEKKLSEKESNVNDALKEREDKVKLSEENIKIMKISLREKEEFVNERQKKLDKKELWLNNREKRLAIAFDEARQENLL